ncbi:MAG: hypothetical protein Q7S87_13605 [Agitococcus sp.]|jgi:hypothetical protein|nr:hypothetical protein [Agitococcus sp.]
MQAIEFPVEIDSNKQIHLQLPKDIQAHKARVIVIYDDIQKTLKPISVGLFTSKITMSDDFDAPLSDDFWLSGGVL